MPPKTSSLDPLTVPSGRSDPLKQIAIPRIVLPIETAPQKKRASAASRIPVPAFSQTLRLFRLTAVFLRGRVLLWRRLTLLQFLVLLGVLLPQGVGLLLVLLFQLLVSLVASFLLGRPLVVFLLLRRQLLAFLILLLIQFVLLSLVFLVQCRISGVRRGARCGLNVLDVARFGGRGRRFGPRYVVVFGARCSVVRRAFRSLVRSAGFSCRHDSIALEFIRPLRCGNRRTSLVR